MDQNNKKPGAIAPKYVAIAFGALAVLIGGLVFALEGSQPDFVCRLKSGCREYGLCVSARFSCTVGTTEDCRSSDVCRKDGLCSASGGTCIAATDEDCAGSEACKKDAHCVQLDASCTGAGQRDAIRAMEGQRTATKAIAEFLEPAVVGAKGGNTAIAIASFFAASQVEGFSVESPEPRVEAAEWGVTTHNGRALPAAVIRATFAEVNRSEGKRRRSCLVWALAHDKEFGMWRQMEAWSCSNPRLAEKLSEWRADSKFAAKGTWAETQAVSLAGVATKGP